MIYWIHIAPRVRQLRNIPFVIYPLPTYENFPLKSCYDDNLNMVSLFLLLIILSLFLPPFQAYLLSSFFLLPSSFLLPSFPPSFLPSFLPALLPSFLTSCLTSFFPYFLPYFLLSLLPSFFYFLPAFLPAFLPSFFPYCLLSLFIFHPNSHCSFHPYSFFILPAL